MLRLGLVLSICFLPLYLPAQFIEVIGKWQFKSFHTDTTATGQIQEEISGFLQAMYGKGFFYFRTDSSYKSTFFQGDQGTWRMNSAKDSVYLFSKMGQADLKMKFEQISFAEAILHFHGEKMWVKRSLLKPEDEYDFKMNTVMLDRGDTFLSDTAIVAIVDTQDVRVDITTSSSKDSLPAPTNIVATLEPSRDSTVVPNDTLVVEKTNSEPNLETSIGLQTEDLFGIWSLQMLSGPEGKQEEPQWLKNLGDKFIVFFSEKGEFTIDLEETSVLGDWIYQPDQAQLTLMHNGKAWNCSLRTKNEQTFILLSLGSGFRWKMAPIGEDLPQTTKEESEKEVGRPKGTTMRSKPQN